MPQNVVTVEMLLAVVVEYAMNLRIKILHMLHMYSVYYWLDDSLYIHYHVLNTINVMWGLISKNEKKKGKI